VATDSPPIAARRRASVRTWALGLIGVAVILAAYARIFHGEFLWDDDAHIYANPTIVGPLGLKEIWTSGKANYFPLTMTSFWVQHALWGLAPGPYHFVTILFHIGAALLFWRVLARLGLPGAWFGAMLWALHPVQVESVAWICELKNTQSAFFYLLAIYFFVRWIPRDQAPKVSRDYVMAWIAAILAVLSKSSTVMLPVVLGLIGWWMGKRQWRDVLWLVPFFAVSLVAGGWTIWEQKVNSMASGPDWNHGLASRFMIAGKVPWFYLGKLLWPHPLVFIYPRWDVNDLGFIHWLPLVGTVAVIVVLWWARETRAKPLFLAVMIFGVSLFPVLGLFDVFFFKYSFVGDHFQYLASMGLLGAAGAAIAWGAQRVAAKVPHLETVAAVVLLGLLGALTLKQTGIYLTREALWRDTVNRNPHAWIGQMNLGSEYMSTGRPALAIPHFQASVQLRPGDGLSEANWGGALVQLGKAAEAIPHLEAAVRLMPNLAEAYSSLGLALGAVGRTADAIAQFETALRLKPRFEGALLNLCNLLAQTGRTNEALQRMTAALREEPRSATYHRSIGILLKHAGQRDPAIDYFRAAVQLNPSDFDSLHALLELFIQKGQYPQAIEIGASALRLRPDSAACHYLVANALLLSGRAKEAIPHYEQTLRLQPNNLDARSNLGSALYQSGRAADAVPHYVAVAQAQPKAAGPRNNLASALMQAGQLPGAIQQYREALSLEPDYVEGRMNLALALEAAGQKNEAIEQYEELLRRKPDHQPAQEKLKRLRAP
jgi:protein O-mannosyl-transferase